MAKIVIGKQYKELLETLTREYLSNKDKYEIKERSIHDIDNRICPFCKNPAISGFVEIILNSENAKEKYHPHVDCI